MEHEKEIMVAKIRLLRSDNLLLQQEMRKKRAEISLLKKQIRRLELKVPKKITEYQYSMDGFV